jgi:hypothetical protein
MRLEYPLAAGLPYPVFGLLLSPIIASANELQLDVRDHKRFTAEKR